MDRGPSVIEASGFAGGHGRRGPGDEDRRRRYGRRPVEPVPQISPASRYPPGFPKGDKQHDDAEGDRRSRVFPGAGARPERAIRPSTTPSRTARTCPASRPVTRARAPRLLRPSRDREPLRRCAEGVDRELPRVRRADAARSPGEHPGDRARVRVGGRRRHERHQLLRRRPADRTQRRRDVRGRAQRHSRRRRRRDRRRQRPRGLRPRHDRIAGHRARRDLGRSDLEQSHVFAPALSVVGAPPNLGAVPLQSAGGAKLPGAWSTLDQAIVDVRSVVGTDGKPVESHLCGSTTDPNEHARHASEELRDPGRSCSPTAALHVHLEGAARAERRRRRADPDRQPLRRGKPDPVQLPIAVWMISDLDGKRLRALSRGERRTGVDPRSTRHPGDPDRIAAASSRASRPPARPTSATS